MNTYSKTIRTQVSVLALLFLLASLAQAQDKTQKLDLNGFWITDHGGDVKVTQTGSTVVGTFTWGGECPFGAPPRTTYFEGQLSFSRDGTASLDGTVYLCTETKVVYDCGFGNYSAQVHGIALENTITITYNSEYYRDESDNNKSQDKKCPHNWVRDPSGDSGRKLSLIRNCPKLREKFRDAGAKLANCDNNCPATDNSSYNSTVGKHVECLRACDAALKAMQDAIFKAPTGCTVESSRFPTPMEKRTSP